MSSNLVQLSYKPGIQRDGSKFQGDFCTDGQWVRFQRGKVKKIGGMKGISANSALSSVSEIMLKEINTYHIYYYICSTEGIYGGTIDNEFNSIEDDGELTNNFIGPYAQWQATKVIKNNNAIIVFLATENELDIAQNHPSRIFSQEINAQITELNITDIGIDPAINGGMCFSAPYLFLYGSNGIVQYSDSSDPLYFVIPEKPILPEDPTDAQQAAHIEALKVYSARLPTAPGKLIISNDKVIYGKAVRGGPNNPTVLFWTLSSIVKISNIGTDIPTFQKDVIYEGSSILSTKCVVEYDGLFFWPGTDGFYVYNGMVTRLVNTMNHNYFFDNIDMDYRQKVFGVKKAKFDEIWWYYPEKVGTIGRDPRLPIGSNSKVIIYNKTYNCWYDTIGYADCGTFAQELGYVVTYGTSLVNPVYNRSQTFLWRHEYGIREYIPRIAELNNKIPAYITTPIFGWSSFNPIYSGQKAPLIDRWIEIRRIEPDFIVTAANQLIPAPANQINVIVNTKKYAQSPVVSSEPFPFLDTTEKIDLRVQGRQISLTFSSEDDFEMGNIIILVGMGDGQ